MKAVLLVSVSVLALCTCGSGTVYAIGDWPTRDVRLYSQNYKDIGSGIQSDNFTSGFTMSAFNSSGADDFAIPSGHSWRIKEVDVTGRYVYRSGPATSENIIFYSNSKGAPLSRVAACPHLNGIDTQGSFSITIPKTCDIVLAGGAIYWLSVVANQDYLDHGAWAWETKIGKRGYRAVWENPHGGFYGGRCNSWTHLRDCWLPTGKDFMFELKGVDRVKGN